MTDAERLEQEKQYADKLMKLLLKVRPKDYDHVVLVAAMKEEHDKRRGIK